MFCDHLLLFCLWTEWCRALFFSLFFFFPYWYCTGSGIISSDNICLFSLDVCLCPALYLIWNHHSIPRKRLFKIRLITSTFNLVFFHSFLHPFALLQVNVSSHAGDTLKYLFNTYCPSLSLSKLSSQMCSISFCLYDYPLHNICPQR